MLYIKSNHKPDCTVRCSPSYKSKEFSTIIRKAAFVAGRDVTSVKALSGVLRRSEASTVRPDDVTLVRDPVLSNTMLTDSEGTCWKQSQGAPYMCPQFTC